MLNIDLVEEEKHHPGIVRIYGSGSDGWAALERQFKSIACDGLESRICDPVSGVGINFRVSSVDEGFSRLSGAQFELALSQEGFLEVADLVSSLASGENESYQWLRGGADAPKLGEHYSLLVSKSSQGIW